MSKIRHLFSCWATRIGLALLADHFAPQALSYGPIWRCEKEQQGVIVNNHFIL